jgi:hypothetical protein
MNSKYIGPGGRWMIFWGAPGFVIAIIACKWPLLNYVIGSKAAPYVFCGIVMLLAAINCILIDRIPKKLVVPIGIVGWILTVSLLYWFFVFGPGSFDHPSDAWGKNYKGIIWGK